MKKNNQPGRLSTYTPLCDLEAEKAVLGAIINESDALRRIESEFSESLFYDDKNRIVASVIHQLAKENKEIDLVTISAKLRDNNHTKVDGYYLANDLMMRVSSSVHLDSHIILLKDLLAKRQTVELCQRTIHAVMNNDDIGDIQSELSKQLETSQESLYSCSALKHISEHLKEALTAANEKVEKRKRGETIGISTGLTDLDKVLNGWQKSKLYILAARPAMGKTAFAMHFAKSAVMRGYTTAIFSLEMDGASLADRFILSEAEIEAWKYEAGIMNLNELSGLDKVVGKLESLPLYVDDNSTNTIVKIQSKSKALKKRKGLDFIIIDYLQLTDVEDKFGTREQEIAYISREAKKLSRILDIPVLMLSQLSRAVEQRQNKRPQLSDLRESGAIEQDADAVLFLYRPEYYKEPCQDPKTQQDIEHGIVLITAKNRKGATGDIICQHNGSLHKISDKQARTNPF